MSDEISSPPRENDEMVKRLVLSSLEGLPLTDIQWEFLHGVALLMRVGGLNVQAAMACIKLSPTSRGVS